MSTIFKKISVDARAYAAFQEARERAAAANLIAEKLKADAGIPSTAQLVDKLGLRKPTDDGEVAILDTKGQPLGKISVYWTDPYEVKGGFRSRLS